MSDDEINRAIAETCGWQAEHYEHKCDGTTIFRCGACGGLGHSNCYGDGRGAVSFSCSVSPCCDEAVPPDYCGDLNEMHEAEKVIAEMVHATARQRAEAFLRTIGKWKEEAK